MLTAVLLFLTVSQNLTDASALQMAREIVGRHDPDSLKHSFLLMREKDDGRLTTLPGVSVHFGETLVSFKLDGRFRNYSNLSKEVRRAEGRQKFASENQAWTYFETIAAKFVLPPDLNRTKYERLSTEGKIVALRFTMRPRPYGYEASGNLVSGEINAVTGQLIKLTINRDWIYEEPEIKISTERAIARVAAKHGGKPSDWQSKLHYETFPKSELRELKSLHSQRRMRLHYQVWSKNGNAYVDTVTGKVHGFVEMHDHPKVGLALLGQARKART